MPEPRRICLVLEYDGSAYHGWQYQANGLSIQQVLEEALDRITGEGARVVGSGRTDAGVHALGQVAAFDTRSGVAPADFARALNALIPPDIRVLASLQVDPHFHPQYDATGKSYAYMVLNRPEPTALLARRCWHVRAPLDLEAMRSAARQLVGRHDFSAFRSSSCCARDPVRELTSVSIAAGGRLLEFRFEGDGFLKNMVRNIVGTLVDIGRGLIPAGAMPGILASRDRRKAGPCAPPHGLYLLRVSYKSGTHT